MLGSSYAYQPAGYDGDGHYTAEADGSSYVALARLTSAGDLDTSFGSGGVSRKAVFHSEKLTAGAGAIRADGSASITETDPSRSAFVGFATDGGVACRTYTPTFYGTNNADDATNLADGRVGYTTATGSVWTVGTDGAVSNVVTPATFGIYNTTAIVATSGGDLVTVGIVNGGGLKAQAFDAGRATDARPDDLPAALAVSAAYDQYGTLQVAYYDKASETLKYTTRNSAGLWGRTVAVDSTKGAGSQLSIKATPVAGKTAVAIAYYEADDADLRLATTVNGRKFAVTTLASKGAVGQHPSLQFTDGGWYAISYYSKKDNTLYYTLNADGVSKWSITAIDRGGEWNELRFDPSTRRPGIAYSGTGNTVKYALGSRGKFDISTVITTQAGASFVNLALPSNISYAGPLISYYDENSADLVLERFDKSAVSGHKWTPTTIASRGSVGAYNDLLTDAYGDATLYAWTRNTNVVNQYTIARGSTSATVQNVVTGGGTSLAVVSKSDDGYQPATATDLLYLDGVTGQLSVR